MKLSSFNKLPHGRLNCQIQDDFQTTIQFDYLARKVMIRTKSNYRRSIGRRSRHELFMSEISEFELNKLHTSYGIPFWCVHLKD